MNQSQALAKATKILGKSARLRVDPRALVGDELQQARDAATAARDAKTAAEKARDERRNAVLAADAEYQALKAAAASATKAAEAAFGRAWGRRVEVLRAGGIFNTVEAQGDNFADAIAQLERKKGLQS